MAPLKPLLDALVHPAEPGLEPHYRLALGVKAEMAGFDDAGVDRSYRDLVDPLALYGKKGVRIRGPIVRDGISGQRSAHQPATVVEPTAPVLEPLGFEPEEIADGALEPDRRWMQPAKRGEPSLWAGKRSHREHFGCRLEQRRMHRGRLSPQREELDGAARQPAGERLPARPIEEVTGPGPMLGHHRVGGQEFG